MDATLFDDAQLKSDLYAAYYEARRHKRNTVNALEFELDLETNLERLYREIAYGTYRISPSICFIVEKPVKREIFAANFRDRVVHHFVMAKLMPIFENQFIFDSYSCREGKGNLFGIQRLQKFIRSCSDNYQRDAYILKLDIQGFFMNINKPLLCQKILDMIDRKYHKDDIDRLKWLVRIIVMNDPTADCRIKGKRSDWDGLPVNKSLFSTPKDCGLPIGNLTSQVFANYYLNDFDHYMKETLKLRYYGRYVDDFFVVHSDKDFLKGLVSLIDRYLKQTLGANLHPKKCYFQSFAKGVAYLGGFVLPYRSYIGKRPKGNFSESIHCISNVEGKGMSQCVGMPQCVGKPQCDVPTHCGFNENYRSVEAELNSYLGLCQHYANHRLCSCYLTRFPEGLVQYFEFEYYLRKIAYAG